MNDEPPYRYVIANQPYSAAKAERIAKQMFWAGTPDMKSASDLRRVNWKEIARSWNECNQ